MPIRVAFNATPLLSPLTGIGNYIVNLGAAFAATGEIDAHSFYGYRWRRGVPTSLGEGTGEAAQKLRDAIKPWIPFKRELRQVQQQITFGYGLRKRAIEVYHEPNYVPICYDVPVVITVHDLSWLRYPETHPTDRVRWLERGLPRAIERAAAIIVDSDFVRKEVLAAFSVHAAKVRTVHLGVAAEFHPRDAAATAATRLRYKLEHRGYVLAVATIEPRKNLTHVLNAYALLPEALRARFPLVIAGAVGWRAAQMESTLKVLAGRGQLRFLGRVPPAELPALYAASAVFVFPSYYEGFGLPPLEAMASGVPVIFSSRASLPEVVGDGGLGVDPDRPEETCMYLRALLEDAARRDEIARRGIARAALFTWSGCARATSAVYREATEGQPGAA